MKRIAIIAAMSEECRHLRERLGVGARETYLNLSINQTQWEGLAVCLVESGIGKVNAAVASEWANREFSPDLVINTGSAGGLGSACRIGDYVLATQVCHHDVDVTPIGLAYGELPGFPVFYEPDAESLSSLKQVLNAQSHPFHTGLIATGESFIYQPGQVQQIRQRYENVLACEMEAAAVAQVCQMYQTPWLVIRNLSDAADQQALSDFGEYLDQAGQRTADLLMAFLAQSAQKN